MSVRALEKYVSILDQGSPLYSSRVNSVTLWFLMTMFWLHIRKLQTPFIYVQTLLLSSSLVFFTSFVAVWAITDLQECSYNMNLWEKKDELPCSCYRLNSTERWLLVLEHFSATRESREFSIEKLIGSRVVILS